LKQVQYEPLVKEELNQIPCIMFLKRTRLYLYFDMPLSYLTLSFYIYIAGSRIFHAQYFPEWG